MKKVLLFIFFFVILISAKSQKQFKVQYIQFAMTVNGVEGEFQEGVNTFVFNSNDNNDIIWYTASGKKLDFTTVGDKVEGKTYGGYSYQAYTSLDWDGIKCVIMFFTTPNTLRIFYNDDNSIEFYGE
jgi:hypothetical protein